MDYKIKNTYKVTQTQEFSFDCDGFNYLVIYGHHINGGFIAVPNRGICTEASDPKAVSYNTEKLNRLFKDPELSRSLAEAISLHWETVEKGTTTSADILSSIRKTAKADRFTAEKCNFNGEPGYTVCQFHNGAKCCEQYIPEKSYRNFCNAIGVEPEILDGQTENQKPHRAAPVLEREDR